MKTTNKITLVSLAGALSLVGTAFAAWQFNNNVEKVNASNVEITKKTATGSINDVQRFYLTLDQSGAYWTNKDFNNSEDAILDEDKVTSFDVIYTGSSSANDVSDVTLDVTYTVDDAILDYVNVTAGSLAAATSLNNVKSSVYTLPTLTYTANKPTTSASYDVMKSALEGAKVTFTITATVA